MHFSCHTRKLSAEFIYCGRILNDSESLGQQQVRAGSTIHVVQRATPPAGRRFEVQEADIEAAVSALRKVTVQVTLVKSFSPAAIRDVLEEYPEFYTDIGALAILRNLLLWSKIGKIENARRIAETYPILIVSAPFVVKAFRKHGGALGRDELSDGSVTSDDETAAVTATAAAAAAAVAPLAAAALEGNVVRQRASRAGGAISRNQLANALSLSLAGSAPPADADAAGAAEVGAAFDAFMPSANAAADAAVAAATSGPSTSTPSSSTSSLSTSSAAAATSASSVIAATDSAADAARSTSSTGNRISNVTFHNALRNAYLHAVEQQPQQPTLPPPIDAADVPEPIDVDATPPAATPAPAAAAAVPSSLELDNYLEQTRQQYTAELQIMHDMGLVNVARNVPALILCDGDVERAINLVLSGMSM